MLYYHRDMTNADQIYLGIDYGERRMGISFSDASATLAGECKTLNVKSAREAASLIAAEIDSRNLMGIVVGYPLAPDGGSKGERCRMVDHFIGKLNELTELNIYRQDERDSTDEAREALKRSGKRITSKTRREGKIDSIAAVFILQRWLDESGIPRR
ncbi:MAG: Holliday junction resolvase RuvX [candidate division Zixibacteria bacterium]|nr:Holliday junction resolvase RuvX [candidate division Zixibacteria bacterium]